MSVNLQGAAHASPERVVYDEVQSTDPGKFVAFDGARRHGFKVLGNGLGGDVPFHPLVVGLIVDDKPYVRDVPLITRPGVANLAKS